MTIHWGQIFPGKNFITPHIIDYGQTEKFFYELSSGRDIKGDGKLYGVTLAHKGTLEKEYDLSQCFPSRREAEEYIKSLDTLKAVANG